MGKPLAAARDAKLFCKAPGFVNAKHLSDKGTRVPICARPVVLSCTVSHYKAKLSEHAAIKWDQQILQSLLAAVMGVPRCTADR